MEVLDIVKCHTWLLQSYRRILEINKHQKKLVNFKEGKELNDLFCLRQNIIAK